MSWILAAVAVAFAGLAVLAVLCVRVLVAARGLGRELDRTRARLTPKEEKSGQKNQAVPHRKG